MSTNNNRLAAVQQHLGMAPTAAKTNDKPVVYIAGKQMGVAVIMINNPPVNSLHPDVQAGLKKCYQQCIDDSEVKAIVLTGGKTPFFMAGADIEHVHKLQLKGLESPEAKKGLSDFIQQGLDNFNLFESGPKPIVAAINGIALGGGCELAMVCNYRISTPFAQFGQPELNLGLIPGLGGCNRFPRLIGVKKAVDLTVKAKQIKAKEALKLGLIDEIVQPDQLIMRAGQVALEIASGKRKRVIALEKSDKLDLEADLAYIAQQRKVLAAKKKNVLHFNAYFNAVESGLKNGGKAGLQTELKEFAALVASVQSKSLIHFFFATKGTGKVDNKAVNIKDIKTVGIIGMGTMGIGIAINFLMSGFNVVIKEINEEFLLKGTQTMINEISKVIKMRKMNPFAMEFIMRNLNLTYKTEDLKPCQLIIECVVEVLDVKIKVLKEIESVVAPSTILATNTSTLSLDLLTGHLQRPGQLIGLHYFSPAHVMPLLEIIVTKTTSPEVTTKSVLIAKKTKKTGVVVNNCIGFAANRMFFPYAQAASILLNSTSTNKDAKFNNPYQIDRAIEAFGMPMGPFKMCDLSGVDIATHANKIMSTEYKDRIYSNTKFLNYLAEKKQLGQKTGRGVYTYVKNKPVEDKEMNATLNALRTPDVALNLGATNFTDQQIVEICLYPVVNEALRIVDEKIAKSNADVDLISVMGYGFPAYRGGLLFWAQCVGFANINKALNQYSQLYGALNPELKSFFKPCALLQKLAQ